MRLFLPTRKEKKRKIREKKKKKKNTKQNRTRPTRPGEELRDMMLTAEAGGGAAKTFWPRGPTTQKRRSCWVRKVRHRESYLRSPCLTLSYLLSLFFFFSSLSSVSAEATFGRVARATSLSAASATRETPASQTRNLQPFFVVFHPIITSGRPS